MHTSDSRILTTHTGSLPRPAELVQLYIAQGRGGPADAQLAEAGRAALDHVVRKQREAGIDVGNNGEQQREAFFLYVRSRMSGFGGAWTRMPRADVERYPDYKAAMAREQQHVQQVSSRAEIPTAIGDVAISTAPPSRPSALTFARHSMRSTIRSSSRSSPRHHPALSPRRCATTTIRAKSRTLRRSARRCAWNTKHRQAWLSAELDCPDLAMERHISYQHRPLGDFLGFVDRVVATINAALVNIPRDRVRLHACWGNYEGPHDCDVELHEIMPILRKLNVGGFVLPFANPRHAHEYAVLRDFPLDADQVIVAGVIDSVTNFVEHPKTIAERIERVAEAVGDPKRVLAGTDCGFDTSAGQRRVAEDVVWASWRHSARARVLRRSGCSSQGPCRD